MILSHKSTEGIVTKIVLGACIFPLLMLGSCDSNDASVEIVDEIMTGVITREKVLVGGTVLKQGSYTVAKLNEKRIIFSPDYFMYLIDGANIKVSVTSKLPEKWDRDINDLYPEALFVVDLMYSKRMTKDINGEVKEISLYPKQMK